MAAHIINVLIDVLKAHQVKPWTEPELEQLLLLRQWDVLSTEAYFDLVNIVSPLNPRTHNMLIVALGELTRLWVRLGFPATHEQWMEREMAECAQPM